MNRLFAAIGASFLAAQFNLLSAQTAVMQIWRGGGVVSSISTTDIDSITFVTSKIDLGGGVYLIDGHKFVDLGLPSGLLWADTNVGAETAADDGNHYAWGETEPQDSSVYNWSSYKFTLTPTKYNSADGKTTLDKEDDAASANWGLNCRMPSYDEFAELRNSSNCTWTWTSQTTSSGSTVDGYEVASTKNGNSIFLPATGYGINGYISHQGSYGYYWTTTLSNSNSTYAYSLSFRSSSHSLANRYRCLGHPVRPVAEP